MLYLHEQLRLVGAQPMPIERFSSYRGLTSRSIRVNIFTMSLNNIVQSNLLLTRRLYLCTWNSQQQNSTPKHKLKSNGCVAVFSLGVEHEFRVISLPSSLHFGTPTFVKKAGPSRTLTSQPLLKQENIIPTWITSTLTLAQMILLTVLLPALTTLAMHSMSLMLLQSSV